ncbi:hypothetical protein P9H08_10105 [Bacillus cereus]|uniref:hypothetical protein n=1 Tax=Bacillus sp. SRB3LM TaxID=2608689 RepID=UPI00077A1C70|nr:hypothetical protein [Bacillus sp. SRB3LM]KXY39779.1 hypothetical protein AT257_21950 [Bacillus cereus]MBG0968208.1 hypothetical protein [Bacillus sp. SRB3LM]MBG0972869.1 hypothetical protein [Bacillus sp. SRB3LM]MEC2257028.1 hypothetical protein [Bacillus cereus]
MIKSLVEWRKRSLKFLTIFSPLITIFCVYIFGIDFAGYISKLSPTLSTELQNKPTLSFTMNSAIVVIIISAVIEWLKYPGEFVIKIKNNSRKEDSYFDIRSDHRPINVHMDCEFKFKNKLLHWLVNILGGLTLQCNFPHWIDYRVENQKDLKTNVLVEEKEEFRIDIGEALQKNIIDSSLYVKISIMSNAFDVNKGYIVPSIQLKSDSKCKRFFLYIIMLLFFDINITNYKIESRNDIY